MSTAGTSFDVCVIGSGAGGAPVAWTLACAGLKVAILERGPSRTSRDFVIDERKNTAEDFWKPDLQHHPHVLRRPDLNHSVLSSDTIPSTVVGGGTVHMGAYFYRLHPVDFRKRTEYGDVPGASVADWPFTYDDLSAYYDKAARLVGISGTDGRNPVEPPAKDPSLLGPLRVHPIAGRIDQACVSMGLHPYSTTMAILPTPYDGRAECFYCRFCVNYGCPTDSKGSMAVTFIPKAMATGNCQLLADCFANRIELDGAGHARRVHYVRPDGSRGIVQTRLVVLACSAIESARLLMLSATDQRPAGLANSSGLVGRNLMFVSNSDVAAFIPFQGPKDPMRSRNPFVLRSIQDFYRLPHAAWPDPDVRYPAGGTISFYQPADNVAAYAKMIAEDRGKGPLWGQKLKDALRRRLRDSLMFGFETFGEFLPNAGTFVKLSNQYKDQWGLPVAEVTVRPHPLTQVNSVYLTKRGIQILQAMGVPEEDMYIRSILGINSFQIHGTCRAGNDPKTSVLDRWCRSHDVPNLFVTDGSFMPSGGGVTMTYTIIANALRVAERIRDNAADCLA